MSFRFYSYDVILLPVDDKTQDISTPPATRRDLRLPGGRTHRGWGTSQADPELPYQLTMRADLIGTDTTTIRDDLNTLRKLCGKYATLYRVDIGNELSYCMAELVQVRTQTDPTTIYRVPVECLFTCYTLWYSNTAHFENTTLDANPKAFATVNNGTAPARNAVLTLTAGDQDITYFRLDNVTLANISFEFTGTVAAGTSLIIDCSPAAPTVRNNGVDAYADFAFTSTHAVDDWLVLWAGSNSLVAYHTKSGGTNPTLNLAYRDVWL